MMRSFTVYNFYQTLSERSSEQKRMQHSQTFSAVRTYTDCCGSATLQHADLQKSASKIYWETETDRERERNYAKFLAKDTLYVSAYTFRTLLKRHVWMCTQCPDILTLRTAIQCTISDNYKGCEKVNHRMSDSRINTATINLLKPTG